METKRDPWWPLPKHENFVLENRRLVVLPTGEYTVKTFSTGTHVVFDAAPGMGGRQVGFPQNDLELRTLLLALAYPEE